MDWFSIVLVLLFVVFPVIQQILEAAKKSGDNESAELPEPDDGEWEVEAGSYESLPAPSSAPQPSSGGWSGGWTDWPDERSEDKSRQDTRARAVPAVADVRKAVIDQLNQRVAVVKRKEAQLAAASPAPPRRTRTRGRHPSLRRALRDPDEARRAFVLAEVLGPPAALRPTILDDVDR